MTVICVGERLIGDSQPCFVVAEISMNHNGDMKLAHKLIDAAAEAGADAAKFQSYRTEDFLVDRSLTYQYVSQGKTVVETEYEMFRRYELPLSAFAELREHCDERGIVFFATPTSEETLAHLVRLGVPLIKNGSDYLVHLPLIRAMARTHLPTVISTGMATLAEVDEAVRTFREAGGRDLVLLVCTSSYPTPPEETHLRRIPALAAGFGCCVGLSDHTQGILAGIGAVALGACMIEKHFTLDKNMPGPDHRFSADPAEFHALVEGIRTMEKSLGDSAIRPTPSEMQGRRDFRLSCVAARDLPVGHCISEADVAYRRPGTGLAPKAQQWLVGQRLTRPVSAGHPFVKEDFS